MRSGVFICGLLLGSALLVRRADAGDGNPGREAYFRYCSSYHGADGRGSGPVAVTLRPKPSNLTQLAKQHGGTFPAEQVADIIDGRKSVAAHGSRKMPVWGLLFSQEKTHETAEAHTHSQVRLIVDYLRSIQDN